MKKLVLYIHGKNGSPAESARYAPLFPDARVLGLDYQSFTPWETGTEIREALEGLRREYGEITLIANSIGAFFSMNADIDRLLRRAYFISPIVDMEKLIQNMLSWGGVTEEALQSQGIIRTAFGEELSWDYLCYVRAHPIRWTAPTEILYGRNDDLTAYETMEAFAREHGAKLTVMETAGHWFHTPEEMRFLDKWINSCEACG